jgi:hypothetical protein
MRDESVGDIADFAKISLLRRLANGTRRLAVCWYKTGGDGSLRLRRGHYDYLKLPDRFRNLDPVVFDGLRRIVEDARCGPHGISALERSGLLGNAVYHRTEVPRRVWLRREWTDELVDSVEQADLVFLDPDNGIEGSRITPRHVALSEIVALRRPGRALAIAHHHSGRRAEAKFLIDRMRSLGCKRVDLIRFRLFMSRLFVVVDHDEAMSEQISAFADRWGDWVMSYRHCEPQEERSVPWRGISADREAVHAAT